MRNLKANFAIVLLLIFTVSTGLAQTIKPNTTTSSSNSVTKRTKPSAFTTGYKVNYVRSYTALTSGLSSTSIDDQNSTNSTVATQYMDGLGRPIQTVGWKASPTGTDMVQMVEYDDYGRPSVQYLPYRSSNTNGTFKADPYGVQETFYSTHFSDEVILYGETLFENDPRNRTTKAMAPGDAWRGSDRGVTTAYATNSSADGVRLWSTAGVPSGGTYAEGQLTKITSTDEDGQQVRQFTDKLGRVILKQVQDSGTGDAHTNWLNTYYIYDDQGNLRYVAPPRAVELLISSSWYWTGAGISDLVFEYAYDARNRMIEKTVPGGGLVEMVYDDLDRLVLSRDANLSNKGEWIFTKYDALNRPVITGIYKNSGARSVLQTSVNDWPFETNVAKHGAQTSNAVEGANITTSSHVNGTTLYKAATGGEIVFLPGFEVENEEMETSFGTLSHQYTFYEGYYDATFPTINSNVDVLTINFYDDYNFTSRSFIDHSSTLAGGTNAVTPAQYADVTGLATGSKVKVLPASGGQWLTTAMFYDDRGRVIQTQADNHLNGEDISSSQYDFSGKVLSTYTSHSNPGVSTTNILKKYTYDHAGRLLNIEEKLNGASSFKRLVTNSYNTLGELDSKELGDNTDPIETLDYKYNVRGWLKSINENFVTNGGTSRYFGMDLSYDYGFSKDGVALNRYNGNIAGVKWRSASSKDKPRAYGFDYDKSNRIMQADFNQDDLDNDIWDKSVADFSLHGLEYDKNGNLLKLRREGVIAGSKTRIDDLSYSYLSSGKSNQLANVSDVKGDMGQGDFKDGTNSADDYAYDANGNMTQDKNKGIQTGDIEYNHLNLPEKITFDNAFNKTITYTYDAAGIKLQKQVDNEGNITTTDYVGGFLYQNDALQQFAHEEGRVRLSNGNLVYDYFIKDHLGNTRMTLTEEVSVTEYKAAFETGVSSTSGEDIGAYEESVFLNVPATRDASTTHNTSDVPGITDVGVARLNGSVSTRRIGPGKLIAVTAGDQIAVDVDYYHTGGYSSQGTWANTDMLPLIAGVFGGVSGGTGGEQEIYDFFNTGAGNVAFVGSQGSANNVKAYLNVLVFDQDFNYVPSGAFYTQVRNSSGYASLSKTVNLSQGGYVYVYLSNESKADFNVYFDDLNIVHTKGEILQEDHYYPFGGSIAALSSTAPLSKPNHYKLSGNEHQTEFDLNLYDFNARTYDPILGRFMQVDPMVDKREWLTPYNYVQNNPLTRVDPEGTEDWYANEAGEMTYDENIKSQEDLDKKGIKGEYKGEQGWGEINEETGGFTHYNKDGTTSDVARDLGEVTVTPNPVEMGALNATKEFMNHPVTKGVKFMATSLIGAGVLNSYKLFNTAKLTTDLVRGSSVVSKGTNVVYQGLDGAGKVRYVGITSRAPQVRFAEHLNSIGTGKELLRYRVVPGATNLSRTGARVAEQRLINQFGLGKNSGQLLNRINSISPSKWLANGIK